MNAEMGCRRHVNKSRTPTPLRRAPPPLHRPEKAAISCIMHAAPTPLIVLAAGLAAAAAMAGAGFALWITHGAAMLQALSGSALAWCL